MGFETEYRLETAQYADILPSHGKAKGKDSYEDLKKVKPAKPAKAMKVEKPKENPSWGSMYKDRSNFNDMHCF